MQTIEIENLINDPLVLDMLTNNFYLDDGLGESNNLATAIHSQQQCCVNVINVVVYLVELLDLYDCIGLVGTAMFCYILESIDHVRVDRVLFLPFLALLGRCLELLVYVSVSALTSISLKGIYAILIRTSYF
uniref:Uncharacterized protein n=1 Tax=Glossina palpalis gambiensis TaxID=67801 RepID=A0A1B0BVS3_9MUSC